MHRPLKTVLDIFKCQVLAAFIALVLVFLLAQFASLSFALGELVMLLGNGFLAWQVYRQNKRLVPMSMLWGFLGGETGKYVLLFVFTLLLAKTVPINWLFYVIGIAVPQFFGILVYFIWQHFKR